MAKLICFAGLDGSGKTTQAQKIYDFLTERNKESKFIRFHTEPLKVEMAGIVERTTKYLMKNHMMLSMNEIETLKEAFHIQMKVQNEIEPACSKMEYVVLDRYYETYDAFSYYTGEINWVQKINAPFRKPDYYFFIDVEAETCYERIKKSGRRISSHESIENLTLARKYYMDNAEKYSYIFINGEQPIDKIQQDIRKCLL